MKRIILTIILFLSCLFITSCESKQDQLVTCFRAIQSFTSKSYEYIVKIAEAWEEADESIRYNESEFAYHFEQINKDTDWSWIYDNYKEAEKLINKKYPTQYQDAKRELFKLFNAGRDIRILAKSITEEYYSKENYDTFIDKINELGDKYLEIRSGIEENFPEIPGSLYSIYEVAE